MARNPIDRLASAVANRLASGATRNRFASAANVRVSSAMVDRLASAVSGRFASGRNVNRVASAVAGRIGGGRVASHDVERLASAVSRRVASRALGRGTVASQINFNRLASAVANRLASAVVRRQQKVETNPATGVGEDATKSAGAADKGAKPNR